MTCKLKQSVGVVLALALSTGVCSAVPPAKKYSSIFKRATIFRDANDNLLQDPEEVKNTTTTGLDGRFVSPPGKGRLVLRGGVNIVTGAPNTTDIILGVSPRGARAPDDNSEVWPKIDTSKSFNLVTRLWKVLTLADVAGKSEQVAGNILGDWVDCIGGNCIDTTPDPKKNPRKLDRANRQMWLAEGQLTALYEFVDGVARRAQGEPFHKPIIALGLELAYFYDSNGRRPVLLSESDLTELLDLSLENMEVPKAEYADGLERLVKILLEFNQAFDGAVGNKFETFDQFQALQRVAHAAALDVRRVDWTTLVSCYTGDGLRQRVADPNLTCGNGAANPPRAVDDNASTQSGRAVAINVLANDVGDNLTVNAVTPAAHGTVAILADGTILYTPSAGFAGNDNFTYTLSNPAGNVSTANVAVNVVGGGGGNNRAPVAAGQTLTVVAGVAQLITLSATDADGDTLSYKVVNSTNRGTLTGTPPNLFYTAQSNYDGPDAFTFKANDGKIDSNVATVTITVKSLNRKPVADGLTVTAVAGVAKTVVLSASDEDRDTLSYTVVSAPSHGTLSGSAPNLIYTAAAGYSGTDSFTYKANDGKADSNVATVGITVTAPEATVQEPVLVRLPGGTYQMGSLPIEANRRDDETAHTVTVRAFSIGKYEVTQGEWKAVMGSNPASYGNCGDGCPVENVSWNDVQQYLARLNQLTGKRYRLPTEAEWEYAARAGTTTAHYWGDNPSAACPYANIYDIETDGLVQLSATQGFVPYNCRDGFLGTAPVGRLQPNAFGLYDMLGNVQEWTCSDAANPYNGSESVCGSDSSFYKVDRGGSHISDLNGGTVRAASRLADDPNSRAFFVGFRVAHD